MMKLTKKLLATVLVIAIAMLTFVMPAFAANVYSDKSNSWVPGDGCKVIASVDEWDGTGEYGKYPTRKGVILVTEDALSEGIVGHAAIVYSATQIVHAAPQGVILDKNNWKTARSGGFVGVTVKSTSASQDRDVAEWCKEQEGAPYRLLPLMWNERDAFYCSHLIYCGYMDLTGVDLNTDTALYPGFVAPYELINSEETYLVYAYNWSRN